MTCHDVIEVEPYCYSYPKLLEWMPHSVEHARQEGGLEQSHDSADVGLLCDTPTVTY